MVGKTLRWITLGVLISSLIHDTSADCKNDNYSKLAATRIRKDILCSYQRMVRPVFKRDTRIVASFRMALKHLIFDESLNTFSVHSWMVWMWDDEFLKWNPKNYENVKEIVLKTFEIWIPDITLFTASEMNFLQQGIGYSRCTVSYTGKVVCVVPSRYNTRCVPNLYRWPYDEHTCTLNLGSWVYNGDQLNITLNKQGPLLTEYEDSNDWTLLKTESKEVNHIYENVTYGWIKIDFILRRHAIVKTYTIVIPAFALGFLTLACLWLDSLNSSRFIICCSSIICHLLFLIYLGTVLPHTGANCPRIVLFFKDSLLLSLVTLLVTLITHNMEAIWNRHKVILASSLSWILASRIGQIFFLFTINEKQVAEIKTSTLEEDSGGIVSNESTPPPKSPTHHWTIAALVLDRLTFYILFFIYCIFVLLFWI